MLFFIFDTDVVNAASMFFTISVNFLSNFGSVSKSFLVNRRCAGFDDDDTTAAALLEPTLLANVALFGS